MSGGTPWFKSGAPAPGQVGPRSADPAGATGGFTSTGIKRIPTHLAKVNTSGTALTSATVRARVRNPSSRLRCTISVSFEPATKTIVDSYTGSTWIVRALRPGDNEGGQECELHTLESGLALPRAYTIDDQIRLVEIRATLAIPTDGAAANLAGVWRMVTEWEPTIPMCDEEVFGLYSQCDASLVVGTARPLAP